MRKGNGHNIKGPGALNHLGWYSQYLGNQSTTKELIKNVGSFVSPEENVVYGFFYFEKKCVRPMRGQD